MLFRSNFHARAGIRQISGRRQRVAAVVAAARQNANAFLAHAAAETTAARAIAVRVDTIVTTTARAGTTARTAARADRVATETDLLSRTVNAVHPVQQLPHRKEAKTNVNA